MAMQQKQNANQAKEAAQKPRTAEPVGQKPVAPMLQTNQLALQRAVADPRAALPRDILALQRLYGNRAVTRLLQTKLLVGLAGDKYEQEADRVADQVISAPAPPSAQPSHGEAPLSALPQGGFALSRQPEDEEVQTKPLAASITPLVQRQAATEEEEEEQGIAQTKPNLQSLISKPA
jgi:hypothetical protein